MGELPETALDLQAAFFAAVRRQDFEDLQNEMAGRETGRITRFLSSDERERIKDGKSKSERQAEAMTRLQWMLANDPEYAALYEDTFDKLREAEQAAESALEKARLALARAEQNFQATLDSAARLQDGRRVFRDQNGQVRTEHDEKVSDLDAAGIEWRGDEPSYEQFLETQSTVESLGGRIDKIERMQVEVLGHARDRIHDDQDPVSKEELTELKRSLQDSIEFSEQPIMSEATAAFDPMGVISIPSPRP